MKDTVRYPTNAEIRESMTDEELAALVAALPSYSASPVTLASLDSETVTAEIILAWSALMRAMVQVFPEVTCTANKITRDRTPAELESAALSNEASRRYYAAQKAAEEA